MMIGTAIMMKTPKPNKHCACVTYSFEYDDEDDDSDFTCCKLKYFNINM